MGKGDRKTAKGKRNISSYGKARPAKASTGMAKKPATSAPAPAKKAAPAPAVKKAPAKKVAAK
jgi:30S ribosomal protein S31